LDFVFSDPMEWSMGTVEGLAGREQDGAIFS
jgi:hypothetical protein